LGIREKSPVQIDTSLSIVLDVNRSAVVPYNILPENPGAITQIFVIDNLHSSLQNLCELIKEPQYKRKHKGDSISRGYSSFLSLE